MVLINSFEFDLSVYKAVSSGFSSVSNTLLSRICHEPIVGMNEYEFRFLKIDFEFESLLIKNN